MTLGSKFVCFGGGDIGGCGYDGGGIYVRLCWDDLGV